jgi:hypothetical protein
MPFLLCDLDLGGLKDRVTEWVASGSDEPIPPEHPEESTGASNGGRRNGNRAGCVERPLAMHTLTTGIRRRPSPATALIVSVIWIAWTAYEILSSNGPFSGQAGRYFEVLQIIQSSALGVVGFLALSILVEQVWPEVRFDTPTAPATD